MSITREQLEEKSKAELVNLVMDFQRIILESDDESAQVHTRAYLGTCVHAPHD